ncbi:hypothetical protein PCASD_25193 [Puccinia coronata f. sp. avenae]|uniref:Uncharacterized protein n=1 Tax=Puccinia coronata f. sp. avenae TaxID=200324 RepID=A0A2N5S8D1_9BASI|nr:hypothetical protein PCASD_25193 [Puccinia coronata f. sp. avenae]
MKRPTGACNTKFPLDALAPIVQQALDQGCFQGTLSKRLLDAFTKKRPAALPALTGQTQQFERTSRDQSDKSVRPVGSCFGRTVPVRPPLKHGCLSTAQTAVFDRLMPAVRTSGFLRKPSHGVTGPLLIQSRLKKSELASNS